jgi:hypothetical protein
MLLIVFPMSMIASDAVAVLEGAGDVTIDGRPSTAKTAVFAGETVRTGGSARAVVSMRGSMIALAPDSILKVDSTKLDLASGAIVVGGENRAFSVNGIRIATGSAAGSKFLVKRVADHLQVVALAGDLMVGEGQDQAPVPATKGVDISKGKKGSDTVTHRKWLSNPDIGILIVVGAAIAAGVTVGIINSQKSSSPANP